MAPSSLWQRFQQYLPRYDDLDFSIDLSRMKFPEDLFEKMRRKIDKAFAAPNACDAAALMWFYAGNGCGEKEMVIRRRSAPCR